MLLKYQLGSRILRQTTNAVAPPHWSQSILPLCDQASVKQPVDDHIKIAAVSNILFNSGRPGTICLSDQEWRKRAFHDLHGI
jgi:hypothetical protein